MNLVLIGFMGVGKTSVGKGLAEILGWPFIDTDTVIEETRSMTVTEIFAKDGEASFRETEKAVVKGVAKRQRCVIATGGGVVLDQENMDYFRRHGLLIHLTLPPEIIFHRVGYKSERPLLRMGNPRRTLETLFQFRERLYRACSDLTIDRNGLSVKETAVKVVEVASTYGMIGNSERQLIQKG